MFIKILLVRYCYRHFFVKLKFAASEPPLRMYYNIFIEEFNKFLLFAQLRIAMFTHLWRVFKDARQKTFLQNKFFMHLPWYYKFY